MAKHPGRLGKAAMDDGRLPVRDDRTIGRLRKNAVDVELAARGYVKLDHREVERRLKARKNDPARIS